jgi:DNA-binding FrmR family transcriptional regulator
MERADPAGRDRAEDVMPRLRRLEGQVQGIQRMVREGRYCIDVLTQLAAVRGALHEVELLLLRGHLETCVADAIRTGSRKVQGRQIDEMLAALARMRRC